MPAIAHFAPGDAQFPSSEEPGIAQRHAFHYALHYWAACYLWLLWNDFLGTLETQWAKTWTQQGNSTTKERVHAMNTSDNQGRPCENDHKTMHFFGQCIWLAFGKTLVIPIDA